MAGDLAAIMDLPWFARRPWRILPTSFTGDDRRGRLRTRLGQEYINADDIIAFFLFLINKMRRNITQLFPFSSFFFYISIP